MRAYLVGLLLVLLLVIGLGVRLLPGNPSREASTGGVRVAQVDTSRYPQVTLYVGVEDAAGQTRPDLQRDDFVITEDGTPVDVTAFQGAGAVQVSTLLLMDCSGSMKDDDKLEGAQDAARRYVDLMRPGDQTAVMSFCSSDSKVLQSFTSDQTRIERAIDRLDADGSTPLYDGLVHGIDMLAQQQGRRALILLSDGQDCYEKPCRDNPGSAATLDQVIARAQGAGLDVQAIGLGEPGDDSFDEKALRRIADQTGGNYFHAPDAEDLAMLYSSLGGSLHAEYALTYTSPRAEYDGTRRAIEVAVDGGRSASGYVEQHLINVHSNGVVGILLLIPIVGAIAAPAVLRRRRATASLPASRIPTGNLVAALPTSGTVSVLSSVEEAPPQTYTSRRCVSCGTQLRERARFCNGCGKQQPTAGRE